MDEPTPTRVIANLPGTGGNYMAMDHPSMGLGVDEHRHLVFDMRDADVVFRSTAPVPDGIDVALQVQAGVDAGGFAVKFMYALDGEGQWHQLGAVVRDAS